MTKKEAIDNLKFIYDRMSCVHCEKTGYDYMINFKSAIELLENDNNNESKEYIIDGGTRELWREAYITALDGGRHSSSCKIEADEAVKNYHEAMRELGKKNLIE